MISSEVSTLDASDLQRTPWGAVCFRLLLAVSLWQMPMVWAHHHSQDAEELAEHLARFHANEPNPSCLGWHWHFPTTEAGLPGTSEHDGEYFESLPRMVPPSVDIVDGNAFSPSFLTALGPASQSLQAQFEAEYSQRGFLATFSPEHSTQQMLCRMTC